MADQLRYLSGMSPGELIGSGSVAAVVTDPRSRDNPIVECNDAFIALTGYAREEIIGRNCRFLRGPGTEPAMTQILRDAIRESRPAMVEILNYKKGGIPFRNAVMVAPIFDDDGVARYFLGSQFEIEGNVQGAVEQRGSQARSRIELLSPRQKEVLMQMARGRLNKQIAHHLGLTERTVKMHRAALLDALGLRTSADAIRMAVEAGF